MRATRTFTDKTGVMRKNGEEWLIKMEDTEAHIPDVYEEASGFINKQRPRVNFQGSNQHLECHTMGPLHCGCIESIEGVLEEVSIMEIPHHCFKYFYFV